MIRYKSLDYLLPVAAIFLNSLFLCGPADIALAQKEEDKFTASKPLSYYQSIGERNLFKPLWGKPEVKKPGAEQREADAERRKLEAELKRLKAGLKLSGIVNNGEYYQAIIEDRRKKGGSFFYKEGDIIEEAKITGINKDKLEVILDFKGEEIILTLMSAPEKNGKSLSSGTQTPAKTTKTLTPQKSIFPPGHPGNMKAKDAKRRKLARKFLPLRGYLGIDVQEITPRLAKKLRLSFKEGLYIVRVRDGTQADKEGLTRGDLILGINDQKVRNLKDVQRIFEKAGSDDGVSLTIAKDKSQAEQVLTFEFMD